MDFPPLDDTRWDRLLGAVIGQRPTVSDPESPLATSFPVPQDWQELARKVATDDAREIDLDAYA